MERMTEAMYYLMLAMRTPAHGYRLMARVYEISHGRVSMGPGTMYGLLKRMEEAKLVIQEPCEGRRKIYRLTLEGEGALRTEYGRLQAMVLDGIALKNPPQKLDAPPLQVGRELK